MNKSSTFRKVLEYGGLISGIVLVAFGVVAIVMGFNGRSTISTNLKQEQIVGSADMTPAGIAVEAKKAGLTNISFPTCSIANKAVTNGTEARCFASYMRIHALEATGGTPYASTPRYATADGKGTNDETLALQANGKPVDNAVRNVWVTETALTSALNLAYTAQQVALFGIVVGFALLLSGIGFIILSLGGALRGLAWPAREKTAALPVTGRPSA